MKKLLVFALVFSMLFGISGVIADSQTVNGTVPKNMDFKLNAILVHYGSVMPGMSSNVRPILITVSENNNVDFTIDIELTEDSDPLFKNIFFDLDGDLAYDESEQLDEVLVWSIINRDERFPLIVNSILKVPAGFPPTTESTGTITYTVTVPMETPTV